MQRFLNSVSLLNPEAQAYVDPERLPMVLRGRRTEAPLFKGVQCINCTHLNDFGEVICSNCQNIMLVHHLTDQERQERLQNLADARKAVLVYREGRGVAQSDTNAFEWFRKAVEQWIRYMTLLDGETPGSLARLAR